MSFNIYCDETSHLKHSKNKIMVLGFICCLKSSSKKISIELRNIKTKHRLSRNYELKWTKVSMSKLEYYKELIRYFFNNDNLSFRCVIADKNNLNYEYYHLSHDDWYYRMYYLLLGKTLLEDCRYYIYLDIKDTCSSTKIIKLKNVLNNSYYDFSGDMIKNIQHIKSHESEMLQLNDFLIGAIGYKNNNLGSSEAKKELVRYLEETSGKSLIASTTKLEYKFNIFKWQGNCHDM